MTAFFAPTRRTRKHETIDQTPLRLVDDTNCGGSVIGFSMRKDAVRPPRASLLYGMYNGAMVVALTEIMP